MTSIIEMYPGDDATTPSRIGQSCRSLPPHPAIDVGLSPSCCVTCGCYCIATLAYLTGGAGSCYYNPPQFGDGLCWGHDTFHVSYNPPASTCLKTPAGCHFSARVRTAQTGFCIGLNTPLIRFNLIDTAGWVLYYSGPDSFGFPCVVYANIQFQPVQVTPHCTTCPVAACGCDGLNFPCFPATGAVVPSDPANCAPGSGDFTMDTINSPDSTIQCSPSGGAVPTCP